MLQQDRASQQAINTDSPAMDPPVAGVNEADAACYTHGTTDGVHASWIHAQYECVFRSTFSALKALYC